MNSHSAKTKLITALRVVVGGDGDGGHEALIADLIALINIPRVRYVNHRKAARRLITPLRTLAALPDANCAPKAPISLKPRLATLADDFTNLFKDVLDQRTLRSLVAVVMEATVVLEQLKAAHGQQDHKPAFSRAGKRRIQSIIPVLDLVACEDFKAVVLTKAG